MNISSIHQNMPGQCKHPASTFASDPANSVTFITRRSDRNIPGIRTLTYDTRRTAKPPTHPYLLSTENAVLHGQEVARVLLSLRKEGFVPDIVVGHPGWAAQPARR